MKNFIFIVLILVNCGTRAFAQGRDQSDPRLYTATSVASPTTTVPKETIQTLAMQAANNTNRGKSMANAAIAVTTVGVAASCFPKRNSCPYFVGGLVASLAVRMFMNGATDTSHQTVDAVSTFEDPYNLKAASNPDSPKPGADYTQEPDWKNAITALNKLKKDGWQIDVAKGKITPPNGKAFTTAVVSSVAAMKAAGAGPSDIKAFQDAMAKIPAVAAEKLKAADSNATHGEELEAGGGGQKSSPTNSAAGEGSVSFGSIGTKSQNSMINRDPAQIAGMSKDLNGSPIGVSADSLFDMIVRRYQLHEKQGSFLPGNN